MMLPFQVSPWTNFYAPRFPHTHHNYYWYRLLYSINSSSGDVLLMLLLPFLVVSEAVEMYDVCMYEYCLLES